MAITKGKKIGRKKVHRAGGKLRSSPAKARQKKGAKGEGYGVALGANQSRRVPISKARRLVVERPAQRGGGSWDTQKWLIGKKLAHVVKEKLIADFRNEESGLEEKARQLRKRR